jgi:hypothetical protein
MYFSMFNLPCGRIVAQERKQIERANIKETEKRISAILGFFASLQCP